MMLHIDPEVWDKTLDFLRTAIDEQSFTTWLEPTRFDSYEEDHNRLSLSVPSDFFREWLNIKYRGKIEEALAAVTGRSIQVVFRVSGNGAHADEGTLESELGLDDSDSSGPWIGELRENAESCPVVYSQRLNPRYTFESFVVGESNRFACAAARAVADPTSKAYNPLFVYGGTGLGKTHLMHAIGNQIVQAHGNIKAYYVSSEQFMNLFIDAIAQKRQMDFRSYFRGCDVLLIDDIQFFIGKERTQTEFFHTFNALYESGRKIVVSSDRPPKELAPLEERLRSRFEWGLIVDIQKPDLETRVAILRQKARMESVKVPQNVILFLAEHVKSNIRELEGALLRLKAYATLHECPIDLPIARSAVGRLLINAEAPTRLTVEDIQHVVCNYFDIKRNDLLGVSRAKRFCEPRHIAQFLSRKLTSLSLPDIGQRFGGRDHTSVLHACKRIERNMEKDPNLANLVNYLTKSLRDKAGKSG